VHDSVPQLEATLRRIARNGTKVKDFFHSKLKIDTPEGRQTFQQNPTLQDLYGLLRHLDAWPQLCALESAPSEPTREDTEKIPLRLMPKSSLSSRPGSGDADASQAPTEVSADIDRRELAGLATLLKDTLPRGDYIKLEAQLLQLKSAEEVRDLLHTAKQEHGIVPDYKSLSLVIENEGGEQESNVAFAPKRLSSVLAAAPGGNDEEQTRAKGRTAGEETITRFLKGQGPVTNYLKRRHRFIEPMYRRRRLKWLEKIQANRIKAKDLQLNDYWPLHPDRKEKWPTNMGSVTVKWPSPWH